MRVLILCLALMLPGCTAITAFNKVASGEIHNVTPKQVYDIHLAYAAAQVPLALYRSLPYCEQQPVKPCQTIPIAKRIKAADAVAVRQLALLKQFSEEHDVVNLSATYDAAVLAVGTMKELAAVYNGS